MDITSTGVGGSSTSIAQTLAGSQPISQQEFLKLLVTQLANQDPLSPQDDKQFLAQMAQFSTVEGVNGVNTGVNQLQAAAMLGKTVVATEGAGSAIVTGQVKSVSFRSDGAHLLVDGHDVLLSQVQQVNQ